MANDKQNKTSEAQLRAIKKYEEKQKELVDNIRVRVPHGWKDLLVQYVKEHPEYNSVNALLTDWTAKRRKTDNQKIHCRKRNHQEIQQVLLWYAI